MYLARLAAVLLALACPTWAAAATAGDDCDAGGADCVAVNHWNVDVSIGAGVRTNPLAQTPGIPLIVIPHVSYYGKRFFLENLEVGYTFVDRPTTTLSLIAAPGYDRAFFYRSDAQNFFINSLGLDASQGGNQTPGSSGSPGLPGLEGTRSLSRRVTYLAGPEWTGSFGRFTAQLDVLHEATGSHHGNEVRGALRFPIHRTADSTIAANVGFTWKSSEIVSYYYGLPGLYEPGAALNPFLKVSYEHPINEHWRVTAFAHYEHLGHAIADSPLIAQNYVATMFVGATYAF